MSGSFICKRLEHSMYHCFIGINKYLLISILEILPIQENHQISQSVKVQAKNSWVLICYSSFNIIVQNCCKKFNNKNFWTILYNNIETCLTNKHSRIFSIKLYRLRNLVIFPRLAIFVKCWLIDICP